MACYPTPIGLENLHPCSDSNKSSASLPDIRVPFLGCGSPPQGRWSGGAGKRCRDKNKHLAAKRGEENTTEF